MDIVSFLFLMLIVGPPTLLAIGLLIGLHIWLVYDMIKQIKEGD